MHFGNSLIHRQGAGAVDKAELAAAKASVDCSFAMPHRQARRAPPAISGPTVDGRVAGAINRLLSPAHTRRHQREKRGRWRSLLRSRLAPRGSNAVIGRHLIGEAYFLQEHGLASIPGMPHSPAIDQKQGLEEYTHRHGGG